jgi:nitroreductase
VGRGLLCALLAAAHRAPSEFNLQPWRPVVCTSAEAKQRLQDCCLGQEQVGRAAVDVVVAVSTRAFLDDAPRAVDELVAAGRWPAAERQARLEFVRGCYADAGRLRTHALANGMLFGHQLLLAAVSAGLAGFWLGGLEEEKLRAAFGIPEDAVLAGVVGLGWPGAPEPRLPRLPLARVVSWESWGALGS